MKSPVDVKQVVDAIGDTEEERSAPVRVHVYLDDTASRDLMNIAMAALRPHATNVEVMYDAYLPQHGIPDASADLAVLVAGEGKTGALYHDLQTVGVPVVVFAASADSVMSLAQDEGHAISREDIISPAMPASDGTISDRSADSPLSLDSTDARNMLEAFGRWIVSVYDEKCLAFANAFPCVRRPLALDYINETAIQNAGIGVIAIIPGADLPLMTLNEIRMMLSIAGAYGSELSFNRLKEMAAVVGAAFACRGIAREIVGVVPGVGWVVKGGIGYAGTMAMGRALLEYFERGENVTATAQSAVDAVRKAPRWIGVSSEKSLGENAKLAAEATKEGVTKAVGNVTKNAVPAVVSVAQAAGEATGFSKDEIVQTANKLLGSVRGRFGK